MPRLFTAIELPETLRQRLAMVRARVSGARWLDAESLHLTLRFFGDVELPVARELAELLDGVDAQPFALSLEGLGVFGGGHPRSIWAGVSNSAALDALQHAHERIARAAGLAPDSRKFTPHVTVARLRGTRPGDVARYLEAYGGFRSEPFTVDRFVLFSSQPNTGGGPYVAEEIYPLGDGVDGDGPDA